MKNVSKKVLAVVLAITMPVWIVPAIIVGLMVATLHDVYKSFADVLGVE